MSSGQCWERIRNDYNRTCVLGAVWEGIHGRVATDDTDEIMCSLAKDFKGLEEESECPVRGCEEHHSRLGVANTMVHLNDHHHWSRQRIAAWADEEMGLNEKPVVIQESLSQENKKKHTLVKQV